MRYAIVESGGKQYRAVEGETLEVDRLPDDEGTQINFERILMMADGPDFMIGTPTLSGIEVKATIVDHFSGTKVTHFKYSPKKRIRVRGGHRQQYTRLAVEFIGSPGEIRKVAKPEPKPERIEPAEKAPKPVVPERATKKTTARTAEKKVATKKAATPAKTGRSSTAKKSGK